MVATAGEILREDEEGRLRAGFRHRRHPGAHGGGVAGGSGAANAGGEPGAGVPILPAGPLAGRGPQDGWRGTTWPTVYREQMLAICQALFNADADEGISTDELMATAGLTPEGVRKALHDLEGLGIASNDTAITAFVHAGVERASRRRLRQAAELEQGVINLMRERAPDQQKGETFPLHLRNATQELRDEGHAHALPELVRGIVRSIAADGRGEGGGGGSLGLRGTGP